MDVSGRILRAWMPAILAGMTEALPMANPRRTTALAWKDVRPFSCSVGECKLMNHFVLDPKDLEFLTGENLRSYDLYPRSPERPSATQWQTPDRSISLPGHAPEHRIRTLSKIFPNCHRG